MLRVIKSCFAKLTFLALLWHEDRFVSSTAAVVMVGILRNSGRAYISKENKNQRTAEKFRHQTKIKIQFAENYTAFSLELLAFLLLALRFGTTKQKTRFLKCSVSSKQLHWRTLYTSSTRIAPRLLNPFAFSSEWPWSFCSSGLRERKTGWCPFKMSASWNGWGLCFLHSLGTFALEPSTFIPLTVTLVQANSSEIMQVTAPFSSQNQIFFRLTSRHSPTAHLVFVFPLTAAAAAAANSTAVSFKQ